MPTGNELTCYGVTEITNLIQSMLEDSFPDVIIEGEISNFRPSSTGHMYFNLKDEDSIISVVMFKSRTFLLRFKPIDGMMVRARGNISVYSKRGTYQLICESMSLAGEGNILAMLEERKRKLAAEGLFDQALKKQLPLLPSKVAVVTSPTGAAIRDIIRVLKRRHAGINLVILPTPVQGEEAPGRICTQIGVANRFKFGDVIIIARGGGSLEDLLPFYDERVVRAIANSDLPVISAIGHEIDTTLSDLAADLRAPTPSAAAEMVTASREELTRRITALREHITALVTQKCERSRLLYAKFTPDNFSRNISLIVQNRALRVDDVKENLTSNVKEILLKLKHKLELMVQGIQSHSPLELLRKGYAIIRHEKTGLVLNSTESVSIGDGLDIRLFRGKIGADVKEISSNA